MNIYLVELYDHPSDYVNHKAVVAAASPREALDIVRASAAVAEETDKGGIDTSDDWQVIDVSAAAAMPGVPVEWPASVLSMNEGDLREEGRPA